MFVDAEFFIWNLIAKAREMCPKHIYLFKTISLLVRTVAWSIENIRSKIIIHLQDKASNFKQCCLLSSGYMVPILLDCRLFEGHFNSKFEVTEELASTKCSAWKHYRWEYFQRYCEKSDAIQFQVESATICYSWLWGKYMWKRKSYNWTNSQRFWKCKVFIAYGYFFIILE